MLLKQESIAICIFPIWIQKWYSPWRVVPWHFSLNIYHTGSFAAGGAERDKAEGCTDERGKFISITCPESHLYRDLHHTGLPLDPDQVSHEQQTVGGERECVKVTEYCTAIFLKMQLHKCNSSYYSEACGKRTFLFAKHNPAEVGKMLKCLCALSWCSIKIRKVHDFPSCNSGMGSHF